jgi:hypothetical protein
MCRLRVAYSSLLFLPEVERSRCLRSIGEIISRVHAFDSQKTVYFNFKCISIFKVIFLNVLIEISVCCPHCYASFSLTSDGECGLYKAPSEYT